MKNRILSYISPFLLPVGSIDIPPLRDRKDDIPTLALHFLEMFSKKNKRDFKGFSPDGMDAMIRHGGKEMSGS